MNEAGHSICGEVLVITRGAQARNKDRNEIIRIEHVCTRKAGHHKPHKNGTLKWGMGQPQHSFRKS